MHTTHVTNVTLKDSIIDHNQPRDQVISSQISEFEKLPHHFIHRSCDRSYRWEIFFLLHNSLIIQHFWYAQLLWCITFFVFCVFFFFTTFLICKICVTGEWTAPDTLALDSMTAHIPCIVHCTSARADSNKTGLSRRETFIFCLLFLFFFGQQAKNNHIVFVSVHLIEILKRLFLFSLGSSTRHRDSGFTTFSVFAS